MALADEVIAEVAKMRGMRMPKEQIVRALKNGPLSEATPAEIGSMYDMIAKGHVIQPPYRGGRAISAPTGPTPDADLEETLRRSLDAYRQSGGS
jgi:hypothetical protein